jgi:hypothetical protein
MIELKNYINKRIGQIDTEQIGAWFTIKGKMITENEYIAKMVADKHSAYKVPIRMTIDLDGREFVIENEISTWDQDFRSKVVDVVKKDSETMEEIADFTNDLGLKIYLARQELITIKLRAIRNIFHDDNRRLNKYKDADGVSYCDVNDAIENQVKFMRKSRDFRNKAYYNDYEAEIHNLTKDHPVFKDMFKSIKCAM